MTDDPKDRPVDSAPATGLIAYFGYGSLVNDATRHPESVAIRGTLKGWVREWRISGETATGRVCGLTASPKPGSEIHGVLVLDSASELPNLDIREGRYDRHALPAEAFHVHGHVHGHAEEGGDHREALDNAFVYRSKREHYRWGDDAHPIRLSYVDCVLKGYLNHFGEEGPRHFIDTTEGWHIPVLNDRRAPLYARAITVTEDERELFDRLLKHAGVRYI